MGALSSLLVCLTISQNPRGSQVPDSAIRRCGVMGSSEGDDHWFVSLPDLQCTVRTPPTKPQPQYVYCIYSKYKAHALSYVSFTAGWRWNVSTPKIYKIITLFKKTFCTEIYL